MHFKYSSIALCAVLALSALAGPPADAASKKGAAKDRDLKVCQKSSGELVIRTRCRQKETSVSATQIVQGCGSPFADILTATTAFGVIGGSFDSSNSTSRWTALADLPGVTPMDLTDTDIVVASESGTSAVVRCRRGQCVSVNSSSSQGGSSSAGVTGQAVSPCTGSATNPIAPQGTICIYPYAVTNATGATAAAAPAPNFALGIALSWQATSAGATTMEAVWAFTPTLAPGCVTGQNVSGQGVSSSSSLCSSSSSHLSSSSSSQTSSSSLSSQGSSSSTSM